MLKQVKFTEPFIAYKAFTKEMKCRGEQFEVGGTYEKPNIDVVRLCTKDGYHFCKNLEQCFKFYKRESSLFYKIEVLGNYSEDNEKCSTTKFKILEIVDDQTFLDIDKKILEDKLNIPLLRKIQEAHPMMHVAGSAGLFLHGVRLKRWSKNKKNSDLDLISPYFVLFQNFADVEIEHDDIKNSGNDFDETFLFIHDGKDVVVDYKIDPHQRYEIIEYDGFKFKVSKLEHILQAKLKYAMAKNGQKHKDDIYEMVGKKIN